MNPLSANNVESELSYAYLHAVAAQAGVGCKIGTRHDDNAGVDAHLTGWGPFQGGGFLNEVDIKVQLKATVQQPATVANCFSYSFSGVAQYNDLRSETISTPRILVVLFLPQDSNLWLQASEDALVLKNCAYWVSLRNAPESANASSQTVYLPKSQRFEPSQLRTLMAQLSNNEVPKYKGAI
jgi:hypothetical protein